MQPDEFDEVLRTVRAFVRNEVVPLEATIDAEDTIPEPLRHKAAALGLFGYTIAPEHGGMGLTLPEDVRLTFELGWTTPAFRSMFGTNNGIAGYVITHGGTPDQQAAWLPRLASGEVVASFALTEPEAGSDPADLRTTATPDGDGWILNGTKRYITNAPVAGLFVVFARTGPAEGRGKGIGVFLVPSGTPGLTVGPKDLKMGQAGALSAEVFLQDVRVGPEALVGGSDTDGYRIALQALSRGRVHIAALYVGLAERLIHESVEFARNRRQSGRPISDFQLVQAMLADSRTEAYAGRTMVLDAADQFDSGRDPIVAPACAKYFCSEMAGRVADRAVQIHGGAGYMRGVPVERFYRDVRLARLYEGTSQIQQLIIARGMLRA